MGNVAQPPGSSSPGAGYYGLSDSQANPNFYETAGQIMVWSLGPDKSLSSSSKANAAANKDNVLSW